MMIMAKLIKMVWRVCLPMVLVVGAAVPLSADTEKLSFSAGCMLSKAYLQMQNSEYAAAAKTIHSFQSKAKNRPDPGGADHPEVYMALGNCYLMLKDYAKAKAGYQKAIDGDAAHTGAWFNLAKVHYEMKDFEQAGDCFYQAYGNSPNGEKNPEHLYYSGVAYLEAGSSQKAVTIFKDLLKTYSADAKPIWKEHLVQAFFAIDQPKQALPLIQELANTYTGEKQVQWQEILLYQYISLDMPNKAKNLATELTRKDPTRNKWWKALAHIHLNAGEEEAALSALIIYGYLTPMTLEEKRLLADLQLQLGIPVKSIPLYAEMLKEKPDPDTVYHLAMAFRQTGCQKEALDCISTYAPDTDHTDLLMLKANLLYGLNDFKKAAATFRRTGRCAKGSTAGQAWLMAGYAAMQAQDLDACRNDFKTASKYKRQKEAAAKALAQLDQMKAFNANQATIARSEQE